MEIAFLKQHTESIPVIAEWYYEEWRAIYEASGMFFEDVKRTITKRTNTDRVPLAVVALDGGRVLGTGCLKVHDMETGTGLILWLAGIYVEWNQRGKGLGSRPSPR
jgi:L-amino acid N-acyltransferase YncA